jgi:hypothetical protein
MYKHSPHRSKDETMSCLGPVCMKTGVSRICVVQVYTPPTPLPPSVYREEGILTHGEGVMFMRVV